MFHHSTFVPALLTQEDTLFASILSPKNAATSLPWFRT
jgi:hypothetical protein